MIRDAWLRMQKITEALRSPLTARALLFHGVLAGAEHRKVFRRELELVVDIGANRGQFALAAHRWAPLARVVSFEPLDKPASVFRSVFADVEQVSLIQAAIGPISGETLMHVSARDDSSSLLPISAKQSSIFPGTEEIGTTTVQVAPLHEFLSPTDIKGEALLKLDVQGFEYDALVGCQSLIGRFQWVYCECSLVELYSNQKLAVDVISWLDEMGFTLSEIFNPSIRDSNELIQADFLFSRRRNK